MMRASVRTSAHPTAIAMEVGLAVDLVGARASLELKRRSLLALGTALQLPLAVR